MLTPAPKRNWVGGTVKPLYPVGAELDTRRGAAADDRNHCGWALPCRVYADGARHERVVPASSRYGKTAAARISSDWPAAGWTGGVSASSPRRLSTATRGEMEVSASW